MVTQKTPVIEAQEVCFAYPQGAQALQDIHFVAREGESVAMLASNGSGKTTLIKVLAGLLKPQKGIVRICGRDIRHVSKRELYQRVGVVFQNPVDQLFAPTVQEDMAFGPRNLGLSESEVKERIEEALESVRASHVLHRAIHHLSFGEQKRVAMAGVLAMKPAILILDEPTAGLDPAGEALMMRLLNQLNRRQGITVILATHCVDTLPLFADRIYTLNHGRVLQQGPAAQVFCDQEVLQRAGLRLPYIAGLLDELKRYDGVPIGDLPLTIGAAREKLLELIPLDLIAKGRMDNNP